MEVTEQDYRWLQRRVDRLCSLIIGSTATDTQVRDERFILRHQASWLFPTQMDLYDLIYESRFRRLSQQFRGAPDPQ